MGLDTRSAGPIDMERTFEALIAGHPDEVVTHGRVRDVELPRDQGTLALVTLDNGRERRPSSLGPAGLRELHRVLTGLAVRARAGEIRAVGITGTARVFLAGADLRATAGVRDRRQAEGLARLGHRTLGLLGALGVPSFAYVNGTALGGGLETALHATYRTVSSGATGIGLPETYLGLVPGWGGCYLLPRLIGAGPALEVVVTNPQRQNRMLTGAQAFGTGVADALFDAADFLASSIRWTADVLAGDVTVTRTDHTGDADAWHAAVTAARARTDRRTSGAAPAPYRALDLVAAARTAHRDEAFAAEDEALADLIMSDELRAGLYAFDLVGHRARHPAGAPEASLARPVAKVGVIGTGLMASQLALVFVRRLRAPVVVVGRRRDRANAAVGWVRGRLDAQVAGRRIDAATAAAMKGLVTGTDDEAELAGADFVAGAVVEDLVVKQEVLARIEKIVRPDTVLATNTSSLSVTEMSRDLEHPERVVGFHFFNPVAAMPLVEVVRTRHTDEATVATALAMATRLGKSAVLVADAPGFVVNRLIGRLLCEATDALDHGTSLEVVETALRPWGLPMSPFALIQLIGPAVVLHMTDSLRTSLGDRFYVSRVLRSIVAAGRPGLFATDERGRPYVDDAARELVRRAVAESGARTELTAEQLRHRVERSVADEARRMLDEGVVAAAQDIDLCMILGAGYPLHMGGLTPYLDRCGAGERAGGRFLAPGVASLPR